MRSCPLAAPILAFLALAGCEAEPDAGALGEPCSIAVACREGLACVTDRRFPGGYCSVTCPTGDCPEGAACDTSTSLSLCLAGCSAPADCRDGFQCWRERCAPHCAEDADCGVPGATCGSGGECIPPQCTSDADCTPPQRCASGGCVVLSPDGGAALPLAAACARDDECASGICLAAALGGVCTRECTQAVDCFDLGEAACSAVPVDTDADGAADAVRAICAPLPSGSRPMGAACARDEECEARVCQAGQCTEVCDDDTDCARGQICTSLARAGAAGALFRGCGFGPLASAVAIEEIDLGELDLEAGRVATRDLAVPPDAVSLTLQARRVGGDPLELSFVSFVDPTGSTIFDVEEVLALIDQPIRWLPIDTGESISALIPNSTIDRVSLVPGVHRWSLGAVPRTADDRGSARVRLFASIKRAEPRPVITGAIDLDVFLVGVGLSALAATSDARLQGALARLDAILGAAAAVRLGDVSYHEITGADAARFEIIESTEGEASELAGLFRLSATRSGRRLSIFLVRSISGEDAGFRALGIAGGIPGPVALHGTQHSGVVAAFDPSVVGSGATGANVLGHVLAHEIGHYLGLYHPTEQARACGPGEAPSGGCAPFGAGDTLADTPPGDTTNLMYWSIVGSGANDRLSSGQGLVLRWSSMVRP